MFRSAAGACCCSAPAAPRQVRSGRCCKPGRRCCRSSTAPLVGRTSLPGAIARARQRTRVELLAGGLDSADSGFDIVINASASSLNAVSVPLPDSVLRDGTLALDMMYGAAADGFLHWAQRHGAIGRDGLGMLVEQAAESFELWRGIRPPTADVLARAAAATGSARTVKAAIGRAGGALLRLLLLALIAALGLQLYFLCRIALMAVVDPSPPASSVPRRGACCATAARCAGASNGCPTRGLRPTSSAR